MTSAANETVFESTPESWAGFLNPVEMALCLWRRRDLILHLSVHEVSKRYRGAYLGILWSFLSPIFMLLIYTFIFSIVFRARWQGAGSMGGAREYAFALFAGLIPFTVFTEVATRSPSIISSMPNYVKKVIFPVEILPVMILGSALIQSLVSVGILLLGAELFLGAYVPRLWFLPFAYLPLIFLCLGGGWFLASLGVFVRDIGQSIVVVVQVIFYLSPVVYPVAAVPERFQKFLYANPMTAILAGFRHALLWNEPMPWGLWAAWTGAAALAALTGYAWFMKTRHGFAEVI